MRERLSKLSSLPLLRGTKVSGEEERLQNQLRSLRDEPTSTEDEIWEAVSKKKTSARIEPALVVM